MFNFLLILIVGIFAQFIDGTLGMGYGVSSSSLLIAAGFLPLLVSSSVHTAEIFASLASGIAHFKLGNVDKKISLPLTFSGIIGGVIGAYFLVNAPSNIAKPVIGTILLISGLKIFLESFRKTNTTLSHGNFAKKFLLPLGFIGGAVDAFGGGGWGPFCTAVLVSANKKEPRYIVGSVNFAEFFTTIAIVLTFGFTLGFENFLWSVAFPLIVGSVIAAPRAAYTCKKISPIILGTTVGAIIIALNTQTVLKYLPEIIGLKIPIKPDLITVFVIFVLIFLIIFKKYCERKK